MGPLADLDTIRVARAGGLLAIDRCEGSVRGELQVTQVAKAGAALDQAGVDDAVVDNANVRAFGRTRAVSSFRHHRPSMRRVAMGRPDLGGKSGDRMDSYCDFGRPAPRIACSGVTPWIGEGTLLISRPRGLRFGTPAPNTRARGWLPHPEVGCRTRGWLPHDEQSDCPSLCSGPKS